MATKHSPDAVIADSEQIARVWKENPTFTLGEITLAILESKIADTREKHNQVETLRTQLKALVNEQNARLAELASINTRGRSGFRASYGPNSSQYEQAGGTRTDERKRPARKGTTTK
ncbi:MAG: hypothetical protein JOZ52_00405 [Acidobacteria bacterium]|nr:hypothetical protein [Acidobacteriota bacterium]